ncbi:MAG: type I-E CRISPR-associated protein Cas7/Cse4/CasC [Burkholderiales bacterium]|nr:type I-E CRISPR-associated protein Cas7/Cse4/CasC [Burkholderiales bacterium]
MTRFIQLHVLTSYPPSNLNRDDTGRPKTALVGDANRLRISSQSLKRAWRTSAEFARHLPDADVQIGDRTKRVGLEWVFKRLLNNGVPEATARQWSKDIQRAYGEPETSTTDPDAELLNGQLVHLSPIEHEKLSSFVDLLSRYLLQGEPAEAIERIEKAIQNRDKAKDKKKANGALVKQLAELLLVSDSTAVDIALFGRMLASVPAFNFDAAVQVAHAITVHKAAVEDDYFSAVDDLNKSEDTGAGHIGERGYGAGLFYLYIAIDRELLKKNLGGDEALTSRALESLIRAITKVSPTGMQNSFASRAYAGYVLAEKGKQQPRSLAQAYLKPVKPFDDEDIFEKSVDALETRLRNFDAVYGDCADSRYTVNVEKPEGSLDGLVKFVTG